MARRGLPVWRLALLLVASFLVGEQCHQRELSKTETCRRTGDTTTTPARASTSSPPPPPQCRAVIGAVAAEALRKQPHDPAPSNQRHAAQNGTDADSLSEGGNAGAEDTDDDGCHCEGADSNNNNNKIPFPLPVRIAYLVVVHNRRTMDDAVHLIRAVRHPSHHLVVHVDAKARDLVGSSSLQVELDRCRRCFATTKIEAVYDVQWSHWSMNLPTLWGMEQLLRQSEEWDVFVNLSGDTLPVYQPRPLAERLDKFRYNFVTSSSCATGLTPTNVYEFPSFWHKRSHYTNSDSEPDPVFEHVVVDSTNGTTSATTRKQTTVVTHFGSQWMILQRPFVAWLVTELSRPDSLPSQYRDYLAQSGKLMTDETFVPSLLVSQFPETLPRTDEQGFLVPFPPVDGGAGGGGEASPDTYRITDVRYERMDENVPTAFGELWTDQRYVVPNRTRPGGVDAPAESGAAASVVVEPVRPWGPYFLGVYDLGNIRGSGALFARKVSAAIDDNMVRLLPVERTDDIPDIRWPKHEIALLEKPDWSKKIEEWKRRAAEKHRARDASSPEPEDEDEEL